MHSSTRKHGASKWKSSMANASFGCGFGTTEKVLTGMFLAQGSRAGHYGLPGMHERVKVVGGKLAVWSELDSGTEIELTIPGSLAYAKSPSTTQ